MILVTLAPGADASAVRRALTARGLWVEALEDGGRTAHLVAVPPSAAIDPQSLRDLPGVAAVAAPPTRRPRLDAHPATVTIAGVPIGAGAAPVLLAGPCSVESERHVQGAAERVAAAGARFLRGGAFKPRTSPYSFAGHGPRALAWLRRAADAFGLGVVTEATTPEDVPAVAEVADLVQIGSRNMASFGLLHAVGRAGRPALLKRGMSATIDEWLLAAEHLLVHGAPAVIFCERGVRGFDAQTRNLLDLGAAALLAHVHRLPVLVDPSHAAGRRDLVLPLARAAIAAGAAGVLVETHDDPGAALSDGPQAVATGDLAALARHLGVAPAIDRRTQHG
jgi:3-deoxy-7-phosphoheptulonate synthase